MSRAGHFTNYDLLPFNRKIAIDSYEGRKQWFEMVGDTPPPNISNVLGREFSILRSKWAPCFRARRGQLPQPRREHGGRGDPAGATALRDGVRGVPSGLCGPAGVAESPDVAAIATCPLGFPAFRSERRASFHVLAGPTRSRRQQHPGLPGSRAAPAGLTVNATGVRARLPRRLRAPPGLKGPPRLPSPPSFPAGTSCLWLLRGWSRRAWEMRPKMPQAAAWLLPVRA